MGFKDLSLLNQKENQIFLIFLIWRILAYVIEYFLNLNALYLIIPLLSYFSMLFLLSTIQKKKVMEFSFKDNVLILIISNLFGIIPYFLLYDLILLFIFLSTSLVITLILYILLPRFHNKIIFLFPISLIIWVGITACAFAFFLVFFPLIILYNTYKNREKIEVKISSYKYIKLWKFIEFIGGSILGFVVIVLTFIISSILIDVFGEVGFALPGMTIGVLSIMTLMLFLTITLLFFKTFNAWIGTFSMIVGFYAFFLMFKAFYSLGFSGGASNTLVSLLTPFQLIIEIGIFIIDLLLLLFIIGTLIKQKKSMGERKSWKFDITLLWFIISEASFEFINTVSDQEMLGIKNGLAYSFFILVGFVGIIGLFLYGKKINKSKIFKSRRNIILFFIFGCSAFFSFTELSEWVSSLNPILTLPGIPIYNLTFIIGFSIFGLTAIIYYLIIQNKKNSKM